MTRFLHVLRRPTDEEQDRVLEKLARQTVKHAPKPNSGGLRWAANKAMN